MQGKQKTEQTGCPVKDRVEPKEPQGAQSIEVRETTNGDSANGQSSHRTEVPRLDPEWNLLEAILNVDNIFDAQERVISNRGSSGIDGMTVDELSDYLIKNYRELCESIRGGWYKPKPVKRVEIPKPDGGKR